MPRINPEYRRDAKKKIIDAAIEAASEKGVTAVTLEDIAQRVGVTKGALYAYFESREVLFREMTLEVFTRIRSEIEKAFCELGEGPETFSRIADLLFGDLKSYTNIVVQISLITPQDPELQKVVITIQDRIIAFIGDKISRMQREGIVPPGVPPEELAQAILALGIGLRITELHLKKDPGRLKQVWLDSVFRLLSLKAGTV